MSSRNPGRILESLVPRSRDQWLYLVAAFINSYGTGLIVTAGTLYAIKVVHLSAARTGVALTIALLVSLPASIPPGRLAGPAVALARAEDRLMQDRHDVVPGLAPLELDQPPCQRPDPLDPAGYLAVITGTGDRQHACVALTAGTTTNMACVFTMSPKLADPAPGPRPAPELARYDRTTTPPPEPAWAGQATSGPLVVLSNVLENDGQQQSATQGRRQPLADAGHLAVLHAMWTAETTPARHQRYRDLYLAALPPGYQQEPATRPKGCGAPSTRRTWRAWTPPGPSRWRSPSAT